MGLGAIDIVEQVGCPKLCDGGGREEEEWDEDTDLDDKPHRDPYREIDEANEKDQFVGGIEGKVVTAKKTPGLARTTVT